MTRLSRAYGFLDPIQFLSRLRGFAHPSEVSEPVELLRAGVLFHARGLINTKAIQHNLDWIWPYWVERQFNPGDRSFIPRAFSFSHINLTHRNWTAVGLPDIPFYPLVDPRGLVTPVFDGWSLDFWLLGESRQLFPSKLDACKQRLEIGENIRVQTRVDSQKWRLRTEVDVVKAGSHPECRIRVWVRTDSETQLAVAVRPYNPEGISFIESIRIRGGGRDWEVNGRESIRFSSAPAESLLSTYRQGDVWHMHRQATDQTDSVNCDVSMASGMALFEGADFVKEPLEIRVPLVDEMESGHVLSYNSTPAWSDEIGGFSRLTVPDANMVALYDQAIASLILHSPGEVFPGPYTYKRFWYRDAAFIVNALITLGAVDRSRRALDRFPSRQTGAGYFLSQEGEWDSNGEAIWIMHRFCQLTGSPLPREWSRSVRRGAKWIQRKRLPNNLPDSHAGLLPAGFSAEHLGPNDYYYWDNFWGVAGLRCASELVQDDHLELAREFSESARDYWRAIEASFDRVPERVNGAIPASPHRRMDAGAVGSLVGDFPLRLFAPGDGRILATADYLLENSCFRGGFFQNMIHSGINAYLSLHLAQVLLRAGDSRAHDLIDAVRDLATPTGQWPEAIHPQTLGGCMGDGQHVWASAEWAMVMRNLFVREEGSGLVVGAGIYPRWIEQREPMAFGPTLTPHGPVTVSMTPDSDATWRLTLESEWRGTPPPVEIAVPGFTARRPDPRVESWLLYPNS